MWRIIVLALLAIGFTGTFLIAAVLRKDRVTPGVKFWFGTAMLLFVVTMVFIMANLEELRGMSLADLISS